MQCVEISQPGEPEVLRLAQRPRPVAGEGEVLVRVAAAGLNRGDAQQRRGLYPPPTGVTDIPGLEISGHVATLGPGAGASGLREGDAVCALLAGGGYAEYCVVPYNLCLPVPAAVDVVDAAALPEALFTVWGTVWDEAGLVQGETLLVHGGASGIGTAAIQMATALGHRVLVTAGGPQRCAACERLGAAVAIDYRNEDFVQRVHEATGGRGVDVILDMVGGSYVKRNLRALADHGRLVFIAFLDGAKGVVDVREIMMRRLHIFGSTLRSRSHAYKAAIAECLRNQLWPQVEVGLIRPVVDRIYMLHEVQRAHRHLDGGTQIGKILLRMPAA